MTTVEPAAVRPKRLSLSEIVELLLTKGGPSSSVSISRTASGEIVFDVKATAETVAEAGELAEAELARLHALYPRSESSTGPAVSLSRNAKGDTQVEVKGTGWDETKAVYDSARMAYPMANGLTAKPGSVA